MTPYPGRRSSRPAASRRPKQATPRRPRRPMPPTAPAAEYRVGAPSLALSDSGFRHRSRATTTDVDAAALMFVANSGRCVDRPFGLVPGPRDLEASVDVLIAGSGPLGLRNDHRRHVFLRLAHDDGSSTLISESAVFGAAV